MENKTRNKIIRTLQNKMGEIHELLDQIDNCDVADCDEPGYAWCEGHPDRRICHYHATADAEGECYFCPECSLGMDECETEGDQADNEADEGPAQPPIRETLNDIAKASDYVFDQVKVPGVDDNKTPWIITAKNPFLGVYATRLTAYGTDIFQVWMGNPNNDGTLWFSVAPGAVSGLVKLLASLVIPAFGPEADSTADPASQEAHVDD